MLTHVEANEVLPMSTHMSALFNFGPVPLRLNLILPQYSMFALLTLTAAQPQKPYI
jgi:hypothetical protein